MSTIKRIQWIDQVKGFAILTVVYGHNFPILEKYIYSFHMPLFFFLAGMFHPKDVNILTIKKRAKQLLIPYFIWSILLYLFWLILGRYYGDPTKLELSSLKNFIGVFYSQGDRVYMDWGIPMWFLPCIFLVFCIFLLINTIEKKHITLIAIISSFIVGVTISNYSSYSYFWSFDIALVAISFYSCGFFLKKKIINYNQKGMILVLLFLFTINITCLLYNSKIDMYRSNYGNPMLFFIGGMTGSLFWILFFKSVNYFKFLAFLGKNTIIILATHLRVSTFIKLILIIILSKYSSSFNEFDKILMTTLQIIFLIPIINLINKKLPILNGKIQSK